MKRRRSGNPIGVGVRVLLVAVSAGLVTAGCQLVGFGQDTEERGVPDGTLAPAAAVQALVALPVGPAGALTGYDRDCGPGHGCVFGPAWSDDVTVPGGHNGCDTRNDVLARDLHAGQVEGAAVPERVRQPGGCVVLEGVLDEPYTGQLVHFTKEHADQVQIDHVVPLAAAWRAGASTWDPFTRRNFANDPRNLLVVDGHTNQSKGDATPDAWMPPNAGYHCEYARIVVTVKATYKLTVTAAEQQALKSALDRCTPPTVPTT
jgi:Protein of unknown function (DUF1524)